MACQNCGHPSHCDTPLWREERDYSWPRTDYNIKVCDCCRCEKCVKKDD